MPKTYNVRKEDRINPLSKKPSNNIVKVVYGGYETVYDNVHHTNAFVNKIVENDTEWKEIWVNDLKVKWQ
jgi:hypothetical protein